MSGGHFNYEQYKIEQIADDVQSLIDNNDTVNEFGGANGYSPETLKEFENAVKALRIAFVYAHRIDWLESGDDGEETFHKRLKQGLDDIKNQLPDTMREALKEEV